MGLRTTRRDLGFEQSHHQSRGWTQVSLDRYELGVHHQSEQLLPRFQEYLRAGGNDAAGPPGAQRRNRVPAERGYRQGGSRVTRLGQADSLKNGDVPVAP